MEKGPTSRILAGGTDLLVQSRSEKVIFTHLIDLKGVEGLSSIRLLDGKIAIGALTPIGEVHKSELVRAMFPVLADACGQLGSSQTRNKATIGGNLCNASPSAETACPLLVLDAAVKILGFKSVRVVSVHEFFVGPGQTVLGSGEIVKEIVIPFREGILGTSYQKLGRRKAMEIAIANVAVAVTRKENTCLESRIALGAVAPVPMRALKAEAILRGAPWTEEALEEAAMSAAEACQPISDIRASEWYRRKMVRVLVRRALRSAWNRTEFKLS